MKFDGPDSAFNSHEYAQRLTNLRSKLSQEGLDAALVLAPDSQFWLCGLESFISGVLSQALIVAADPNVPLTLVMWEADEPIAHASAKVDHIIGYRFGVDNPVDLFIKAVHDLIPSAKVVGFDGGSRAVPHSTGAALINGLSPIETIDCSDMLANLRLLKSETELNYLRRAGEFANIGLQAAREKLRPGITERELAAEIEYAMRAAGADYPSIPTEMAGGKRASQVHATPSHNKLEAGDLLHVEIGGVENRYTSVGFQTLHVGGAPASKVSRHYYEVALECLRAGLSALHPGVLAKNVEAPALEILRNAGLGDGFKMRFGYGVGAGYPPTWLDPFAITRISTEPMLPGLTFVLHACLLEESENVGVLVGGTYALLESGVEMLAGAGAVELQTV